MKKQYIIPATNVFDLQMQHHVLAGSVTQDGNGTVQTVGVGGDYAGGEVLSRFGDLWDDDEYVEEEEY